MPPTYDPCSQVEPPVLTPPELYNQLDECLPDDPNNKYDNCSDYCKRIRELEIKRCEKLARKVKLALAKAGCPSVLTPFAEGPTMKYADLQDPAPGTGGAGGAAEGGGDLIDLTDTAMPDANTSGGGGQQTTTTSLASFDF